MFVTIADQPRLGVKQVGGISKLIQGGAQTWNARRPWSEPNWCGRKTVIWWQHVMEHEKNMSEISDLIWGWRELNWHDLRIQNLGKDENVLDTANLEKNRILNLRHFFQYLEDSQVIRLRNVSASVIQRWFCKHVDQTLLRVDSCSVFRNKNQSSRRSWKIQPTKSLGGTWPLSHLNGEIKFDD